MAPEVEATSSPVIVLGRIGHYSYQQTCQVALVVDVTERPTAVNLVVWQHDGDEATHQGVVVGPISAGQATFHLTRDCPWAR